MSAVGLILAALTTALQAAAPSRTVSRRYRDFADRDKTELTAGVFTLLNKGGDSGNDYADRLKLLLVGQILLPETTPGEAVEEAELVMLDDVRRFADGVVGAQVSLGAWRQSLQLEAPYGWIAFDLDVGPFDLSQPVDPAQLAAFITFRADYDLAPADGQIDATDQVTLPQG